MNKVILIGNLTRDPEFSTPNNIALCKFTVAVSRRFNQNETDFFPVVTWRGNAEKCQKYLKKGSKVAVVGSIQTRNYEAQDGTKRFAIDINADEVQFLSTRNSAEGEDVPQEPSFRRESVSKLTPVESDDDLPF